MTSQDNYLHIERRAMDLSDYIDVARRHRAWILGPIFAGLVIATVVAFLLPNTYVSQASLRITPAQIAENILPTVVNQQMTDRIGQMQQDILSRSSLVELIQRPGLDLYKREQSRQQLDDVVEKMRARDIRIQIVTLPGQGNRPASAFNISFAYPDRYKAKAVVDALVARFMESNLAQQRLTGTVTSDFLRDEVRDAKANLDRLNNELTDFRSHNIGLLPEQAQMNGQALAALQSQRASLDDALNRDSQEKIILQNQLDTLSSQHDTFATLSPQMSDESVQTQRSERVRDLNKTISDVETQLAAKREMYTESHPDVVTLKGTLESLKRQRDQVQKEEEKAPAAPAASKPSGSRRNVYMTTQLNDLELHANQARSQLQALEVDRANKTKEIDQINRQISLYQSRLQSAPVNEQRYVQLTSDQESANLHYQDLIKKQELSASNQQAQVRKAGENLEVLDAASLPESPTAPNRWLIVGMGFAVGALAGFATAGFREVKDTSLKNLKDVRAYTQLPILSSIPLLENDSLVQGRRRMAYLSWSAAVLMGVVAVTASLVYHFYILKS